MLCSPGFRTCSFLNKSLSALQFRCYNSAGFLNTQPLVVSFIRHSVDFSHNLEKCASLESLRIFRNTHAQIRYGQRFYIAAMFKLVGLDERQKLPTILKQRQQPRPIFQELFLHRMMGNHSATQSHLCPKGWVWNGVSLKTCVITSSFSRLGTGKRSKTSPAL